MLRPCGLGGLSHRSSSQGPSPAPHTVSLTPGWSWNERGTVGLVPGLPSGPCAPSPFSKGQEVPSALHHAWTTRAGALLPEGRGYCPSSPPAPGPHAHESITTARSPGRLPAVSAFLHDGVQGVQDGLQVPLGLDVRDFLLKGAEEAAVTVPEGPGA